MQRPYLILALMLSLILSNIIQAENVIEHQYVGSTLWNNTYRIATQDNLAFMTMKYGITILDISDPTRPEFISKIFTTGERRTSAYVFPNGDYLYSAGAANSIYIYDISNPYEPTEAGVIPTERRILDFAREGKYLYVCGEYREFYIFDISEPAQPVLVSNTSHCCGGRTVAISVSGNTACLANYEDKNLEIIDITNPTAPQSKSSCEISARDVFMVGKLAYLATGSNGLIILDLTDPAHPVEIGKFDIFDEHLWARRVYVSGNYAYIVHGNRDGYTIVDISDPTNPFLVVQETKDFYATDFLVKDDLLLITDNVKGLKIVEASALEQFNIIGEYKTSSGVQKIDIRDNMAYAATDEGHFYCVDISAPDNPLVVGEVLSDGIQKYGNDVLIHGDYAYVLQGSTLDIIDVSNSSDPNLISSVKYDWFGYKMTISDDLLYIIAVFSGMQVIDISDPLSPVVIGEYSNNSHIRGIEVTGSIAYLGEQHGMHIVDIANPYNPVKIGMYDNRNTDVRGIKVVGDRAYITHQHANLEILDISDYQNIQVVSTIDGNGNDVSRVFQVGDYIFVGEEYSVDVYDIFIESEPLVISQFSTLGGDMEDLEIIGNYLYGAASSGFIIMSATIDQAEYGDVDNSGSINVGDAVCLINYIFKDGSPPSPVRAGDSNGDRHIDVGDVVYLINHIFKNGPPPVVY
ncbi:MAG: dockerin type I domain-containing protein [candidate division Zixibacteria bacterium]